jgi:hypothetical protein
MHGFEITFCASVQSDSWDSGYWEEFDMVVVSSTTMLETGNPRH